MDIPQLLFSFSGRMNRQPYWLIGIAIGFASGTTSAVAALVLPDSLAMLGYIGLVIASVWISIALGVKRAHDRGRSGLFLLLFLVPLLNLWPTVELLFIPGTPGENRFGPDPLARTM